MLAQAIQTMAVAAAVAALLVLLLTMLIVGVTKPLTLGDGIPDRDRGRPQRCQIDCHDRVDEIGEIARTIAVFKSNSAERKRLREAAGRGRRGRG